MSDWLFCPRCEARGEYEHGRRRRESPIHAEYDGLESPDGRLVRCCWWCRIAGKVDSVVSLHSPADILAAAGIADPAAPDGAIRLWQWHLAPQLLRDLSRHGGDEDNVALVPPGVSVPLCLDEGGPFGVCSVSQTNVLGWTVLIGAHA